MRLEGELRFQYAWNKLSCRTLCLTTFKGESVDTHSKRPHSQAWWKACHQSLLVAASPCPPQPSPGAACLRRVLFVLTRWIFRAVSSFSFMMLQLVAHSKSDRCSCVKNETREFQREIQTLPPHTWSIAVWMWSLDCFKKLLTRSPTNSYAEKLCDEGISDTVRLALFEA